MRYYITLIFTCAGMSLALADDARDCTSSPPDRQIAACTKLLGIGKSLKPDMRASVYGNRAIARQRKGEWEPAILDASDAIRLRPKDAGLFRLRAHSYHRLRKSKEALADYAEAIRLDPRDYSSRATKAQILMEEKEYRAAVDEYTEAIGFFPNDGTLNRGRGLAWTRLAANAEFRFKRPNTAYENAVADFTSALQRNPKDALAYGYRGLCYELFGNDKERAASDYREALKIDPNNSAINGLKKLGL